jgi:hypothetical protein
MCKTLPLTFRTVYLNKEWCHSAHLNISLTKNSMNYKVSLTNNLKDDVPNSRLTFKDSLSKFGEESNYVPGTRRSLQGNTKHVPMPSATT